VHNAQTPCCRMQTLTARQRWPNNKPTLTTLAEQARRGMAVSAVGPANAFGHVPADFVNIFGIHEAHVLREEELHERND
jgi:hypothetical protein